MWERGIKSLTTEHQHWEMLMSKCKENLPFRAPKCFALGNIKLKYCKIFCNTTTVQF